MAPKQSFQTILHPNRGKVFYWVPSGGLLALFPEYHRKHYKEGGVTGKGQKGSEWLYSSDRAISTEQMQ
jgi:hypothetical protein